ncbi:MAG TPA: His/Gly/Thr/Pro-type tRNA ligase C-terminal domain-containing protein, partial [Fredinandcohnia sp.]|nr:His/Gly/Thr/Pro-type tRNA ligase C-terminal domain-containing protein [Fredinandcohnia sp.]
GVPAPSTDLFLAFLDEAGRERAQALARAARARGIRTEMDLRGGKLARQLARADKRGARFAVVIGGAELETGRVKLKRMETGEEEEIALDALVEEVWKRR